MSYWKRPKPPSHTTNSKKGSSDGKKTPSKTTNTQKDSNDSTNTKRDWVPIKLATKSDLRYISQLVQLCDVAVYSIAAYLHIYKLAKSIETQKTFDLRDPQGPKQLSNLVGVLDDVVKAINDTILKAQSTTLATECDELGAYRVLMAGVQRVFSVVRELKELEREQATTAGKDKTRPQLPGRDMIEWVEKKYEQLLAFKQGRAGQNLFAWDQCIADVESAFKHLG